MQVAQKIIQEWHFAPTLILSLLNLGYSFLSLGRGEKTFLKGNKFLSRSALVHSSTVGLFLGPGLKVTNPKGSTTHWLISLYPLLCKFLVSSVSDDSIKEIISFPSLISYVLPVQAFNVACISDSYLLRFPQYTKCLKNRSLWMSLYKIEQSGIGGTFAGLLPTLSHSFQNNRLNFREQLAVVRIRQCSSEFKS